MNNNVWRPVQRIRPISIALIHRGTDILVMTVRDDQEKIKGYRPLGGGIDFGETAADTVKREFMEELGLAIEIIALNCVIENLYQHENALGHEIVFVHDAKFNDSSVLRRDAFNFIDAGVDIQGLWIPIADFKTGTATLFPEGLVDKL